MSPQDCPREDTAFSLLGSLNHHVCVLWLLVLASPTLLCLTNIPHTHLPPQLSVISFSPAHLTFEGHDGNLGPCLVQAPQPLRLCLAVLAEVEACSEDAEGQVGVGAQEVGHVPGAVVTGAPGGEPGDTVAAARVQVPG